MNNYIKRSSVNKGYIGFGIIIAIVFVFALASGIGYYLRNKNNAVQKQLQINGRTKTEDIENKTTENNIIDLKTNTDITSNSLKSKNQKSGTFADSQKYIDIFLPLFDKWIHKTAEENEPFLDYKVNKVTFIALKATAKESDQYLFNSNDSSDTFIVEIDFSIRTSKLVNSIETSYWRAGNGVIGKEGWIDHKTLILSVTKNDSGYYITAGGTGP
jgi:hypothetical protein